MTNLVYQTETEHKYIESVSIKIKDPPQKGDSIMLLYSISYLAWYISHYAGSIIASGGIEHN